MARKKKSVKVHGEVGEVESEAGSERCGGGGGGGGSVWGQEGGSLWIPDNICVSTRRALQRSPPSLPGSLLPVH